MVMRLLIAIFMCCICLAACNSAGKGNVAASDDATANTLNCDTATSNPFPLLAYPESWYFGGGSIEAPNNAAIIMYPYLDLHYKTFETITREYGGPSFYREIEYSHGKIRSELGYGNTAYLDSILKKVPEARIMLFHWNNTTDRDSLQCGYDMDLYFLSDGDSLRVIYGMKFIPGTF